jgi:hypothetical protein
MTAMKKLNNYAQAIPREMYERIPKAVWAAIATSALTHGGDEMEHAEFRVAYEWWSLHNAGIVPQKPYMPLPDADLDVNPVTP